MMRKIILVLSAIGLTGLLTACGDPVEVPPAHVGKMSTESGLQDGIIQPSKFRLEAWCIVCNSLVLVEATDYAIVEKMKIYMPKDQLNLDVDVRGVFSISSDEQNVEKVFARLSAEMTKDNDRVRLIPMIKVYTTYAQPVVRAAVRAVLVKYTIAEIMENRDRISDELAQDVRRRLKTTPITTIRFALADLQPPAVIVKAREKAKEREIAIQEAEANKQVSLKEAEAALEVAIKQQEVDLKEAETQVLVDRKLAKGVSPAFVTQRWLKIMEALVKNTDGKVIFMPLEAMQNPAIIMGTLNQALAKTTTSDRGAKTISVDGSKQ